MKKNLKSFLSFLFLILLIGCSSIIKPPNVHQQLAESDFNKKFSPQELKHDLDFLFQTYSDVHPNLYASISKSSVLKKIDKVKNEMTYPMTRTDFYIKVAPIVTLLSDGHTNLFYPFEEYNHRAKNGGLVFPFDLTLRHDDVLIKANYSSDSSIVAGTKLISINEVPSKTIVDSLLQFKTGKRITFRYNSLERQFRALLWTVYKFDNQFKVVLLSPSAKKPDTLQVNGVTVETIKAKRNISTLSVVNYSFHSLPGEKIGIIDFRYFFDLDKFNVFLEQTFKQIKAERINRLIIDIRNNGGGSSKLGDALLNYLTNEPFVQGSRMEVKASKQIKAYYKKFIPGILRWLPLQFVNSFGRKLWATPEDSLAVFSFEPEQPPDNPLGFNGKIYVLIGAHTFSSATLLAATIKDYNIGILVGEETGGLATGFGDVYPFDLPHTHLFAGVSHKRFVRPSGEDDGRGVLPDYEVKQSKENLSNGLDTVMEFVKNLARRK